MPEPLVCAGCSLLCDDVAVADGRFEPACPLGAAWYATRSAEDEAPEATLAGEPVEVETALERAAELLRGGRRPLVHGFAGATIEDARAAVALADDLGAIIAVGGLSGPWPGAPAFPLRGSSTATLGEIRDRSELVVVWREDPETTHPRLLSGSGPRRGIGDDGPPAPRERTLAVLDDRDTPPPARRPAPETGRGSATATR